ncbi:MAG: transposase [Burkholderia sp.]
MSHRNRRSEPGVSAAKLAREHSLNANLAFTWRHRYRAEQRGASEATLLPVTVVSDMRPERSSQRHQSNRKSRNRPYPLA